MYYNCRKETYGLDLNMHTDKRIIKTRTNIKKAFIELTEQQTISKISISDLASKAKVNRSTFYLHYGDVAAVAADIDKEIGAKIAECMDGFNISDIYSSTYSYFKKLTDRLEENESMKRYIIFSTNSVHVINKIKELLVKQTSASLMKKFPALNADRIEYPLTFAAAGILDCYVKWVKSGGGNTTLDELMREVSLITEKIINGLKYTIYGD